MDLVLKLGTIEKKAGAARAWKTLHIANNFPPLTASCTLSRRGTGSRYKRCPGAVPNRQDEGFALVRYLRDFALRERGTANKARDIATLQRARFPSPNFAPHAIEKQLLRGIRRGH
jgi:hypothetical protein